jgi:hypothetical protein
MQNLEKRLIPRIPLGELARGSLSLLLRDHRIGIDRLRDISGSGLSFAVQVPLEVSESIAIEYTDAQVKLEVFGRVAWCSHLHTNASPQTGPDSYLVGVELLSPMMLFAVLPKA